MTRKACAAHAERISPKPPRPAPPEPDEPNYGKITYYARLHTVSISYLSASVSPLRCGIAIGCSVLQAGNSSTDSDKAPKKVRPIPFVHVDNLFASACMARPGTSYLRRPHTIIAVPEDTLALDATWHKIMSTTTARRATISAFRVVPKCMSCRTIR